MSTVFRSIAQLMIRALPPTIHPMLVHFPIALLYVTAAIDTAARLTADRDRFLQRAGFWGLTLAAFFTVLAMAAGVVSEHALRLTPGLGGLLHRHQLFAVLTGLTEGLAWLARVFTPFRNGPGWSLFGYGRGTWTSTVLVVAAAVLVTVTGSIGGSLVYEHGAGIAGLTRIG